MAGRDLLAGMSQQQPAGRGLFATQQEPEQPVQDDAVDPAVTESPERGLLESIGGGFETAATFGTSILAEPVSGIAGMVGSVLPGEQGQGAEWVEGTREALTYQPRGDAGQEYLQDIGESDVMQGLAEGIEATEGFTGKVGETIGGAVGAPGVGYALGVAAPTAIMDALGFKGASKLRGARKIAGLPDDVVDNLAKQGIDVDDLSPQGLEKVQQAVNKRTADEIARLKAFEAEQIPTLQSRVSQQYGDFLEERKLIKADIPEGKAIRARKAEEAAGFQDAVNRYKEQLGIADDAGDAVKDALRARETQLKSDVTQAYKALADATEGKSLPLVGNKVLEAFDDPKIQAMSGRLTPAERAKVNDVLIEYGLDTDSERAADWVARREAQSGYVPVKQQVTPLSINNFEELSQALSGMMGQDASAELKAVAGSLRRGVEAELDQLDEVFKKTSGKDYRFGKDALEAAKRARKVYRELKELQNTDTLVGRMIGGKKRTPDEELILPSEVSKRLLSNTRDGSIENITKVVDQLNKSPGGNTALANLQSTVAARLLEKGVSKQIADGTTGQRLWNPEGFISEFDRLNANGRLEVIFKNNPEGLEGLNRIRELSLASKEPAQIAKASGTADDILNAVSKSDVFRRLLQFGGMAGGGIGGAVAADVAGAAVAKGSSRAGRKAAKKALNVTPNDYRKQMQFNRLYPALYGAIGLMGPTVVKSSQNEDRYKRTR